LFVAFASGCSGASLKRNFSPAFSSDLSSDEFARLEKKVEKKL